MVIAQSEAVSETARERETYKYDALTISTAGLNGSRPAKPIPSSFLSSTLDPGLTAFAQLGLYKLNAGRCMISLFDRKWQHIVAEALRAPTSSSDEPDAQPAPDWFNGLAFERSTSVCEHVVTGSAETQSIPGTAVGLTATDMPVSVINHLDGDTRFCHIRDPGRQFYAGVPIRSPTGINIGVYCVFDDKPRPEGLNDEEVRFIREISRVVMDYLESKRSHEWYRRDQRMVRGLGSFVKGQSTLWKWDESTSDQVASFQDLTGMGEGMLNKKLQTEAEATEPAPALQQKMTPGHEAPGEAHASPSKNAQDRSQVDEVATAPSQPEPTKNSTDPSTSKSQEGPANLPRNDIDRVFAKAANVIRESIEVEGVLFLDASVQSYGGLIGNISSEQPSLFESRHPSTAQSSGDESAQSQSGDSPVAGPSVCDLLGFSTSHSSSIVGDVRPAEFAECREWFLQRLLRRHPHGKVWNFEADGTVADPSNSSDSDPSSVEDRKTLLESTEGGNVASTTTTAKKLVSTAARIMKMFPGARSVAMVPLWDSQTGNIFAGGFAWTRTPTRTFSDENELTYLRVFGLTAMTEVARLKLRVADQAKMDILGSISHELRSPLHGLVGADGILRAIDASGRTLLDTIDHVNFAKISAKKSRMKRRHGGPGFSRRSVLGTPDAMPLPEIPIQLDVLLEEVVESVLAGSSYLTRSETYNSTSFTSAQAPLAPMHPVGSVVVEDQVRGRLFASQGAVQSYIDIDHSVRWAFRMHPGAFRRIIMNLFGNSLKFTSAGFIRVSLRQEGQPKRSDAASTTRVVLTVSDTGKGMSEDFLRNRLFTPFAQEDQFAPGTGLGLSLVRHMAVALGGTIDVASKIGKGTTVTVTLPLPHAADEPMDNEETNFWQNVETLRRQRVKLYGFEREKRASKSLGHNEVKQRSQYQLMEGICRDKLHMDVVPSNSVDSAPPDFVICIADNGHSSDTETMQHVSYCPYIFVCQDLAAAYKLTDEKGGIIPEVYEVCPQPIGLRKLARALLACRLRWQNFQNSSTNAMLAPVDFIDQRHKQEDEQAHITDVVLVIPQGRHRIVSRELSSPTKVDFEISLPAARQPLLGQPTEVIAAEVKLADLNFRAIELRKPIIIVDDNNINLRIMAAYLTKLKHPYAMATNGLEALEMYTKGPAEYSCMLTDISMPVMDGLESTRRIREYELAGGHKPIVVIALTGLSGAEVERNALASGVDLFLTRPLALKGLEKALNGNEGATTRGTQRNFGGRPRRHGRSSPQRGSHRPVRSGRNDRHNGGMTDSSAAHVGRALDVPAVHEAGLDTGMNRLSIANHVSATEGDQSIPRLLDTWSASFDVQGLSFEAPGRVRDQNHAQFPAWSYDDDDDDTTATATIDASRYSQQQSVQMSVVEYSSLAAWSAAPRRDDAWNPLVSSTEEDNPGRSGDRQDTGGSVEGMTHGGAPDDVLTLLLSDNQDCIFQRSWL
ncbi:sensor histidine kinase response [Seiridium cupressi]